MQIIDDRDLVTDDDVADAGWRQALQQPTPQLPAIADNDQGGSSD